MTFLRFRQWRHFSSLNHWGGVAVIFRRLSLRNVSFLQQ